MTAQVKLFNKGKRIIHYGKGLKFKPEAALAFDAETAGRLKRLYPKEVIGLDDVKQQFADAPSVAAEAPGGGAAGDPAAEDSSELLPPPPKNGGKKKAWRKPETDESADE